jgi:pyrroloquinoline-quinone synthase
VTVLWGLCVSDDPPTAVAALGIIEDLFAEISAFIGQSLVARGWLPPELVVHYATHEKLDVEHSESFYKLIDQGYSQSPATRYAVEQGLELGAHVFLRMYRDLYEARARRASRTFTGPHSMAAGTSGWRMPT